MLGEEDADRRLRHKHLQVFTEWLSLSLLEQKGDLDEYLEGLGAGRLGGPFGWREALPHVSVIPPAAREVERMLYLTDWETLLELLAAEHGVGALNPEP